MLKVEENIGGLIAAESKGALQALDHAILSELRLCTTLVEAFEQTALPVASSQKLLQTLTSGINHIVAGRGEMATTIRALTAIKSGSSVAEVSYNCPSEQTYATKNQHAVPRSACPETAFGG